MITMNMAQASKGSPVLADLHHLISEHDPGVLFLTETPREKPSQTLANFLRNRGFTIFHKPPPNKGKIPDDAPIEARLPPSLKELSPPLGCMLACKKRAHWSIHLRQPLIKRKKGSPRIAAARLAAPNLQPLLLVCAYLPAGSGNQDINE